MRKRGTVTIAPPSEPVIFAVVDSVMQVAHEGFEFYLRQYAKASAISSCNSTGNAPLAIADHAILPCSNWAFGEILQICECATAPPSLSLSQIKLFIRVPEHHINSRNDQHG